MNIDWNQIIEKLKLDMTSLIIDVISIAVIFLLARITLGMLIRFTSQVIKRAEKMEENRQKELITSMTLLRSIGRYTIYFAAFCLVINQLGFGSALSSIVTAAGVGALIISGNKKEHEKTE